MQLKTLFVQAALAAVVVAQEGGSPDLTTLLTNTTQLSNLTSFLQQFPDLLTTLGGATNITVLAPSNEAFAKFLETPTGQAAANNTELIPPVLTYHVLNGTYSSQDLSETPAFLPTLLMDTAYTNVTGGQVVEGVLSDNAAVFYTGLLSNSTANNPELLDVAFAGGIVHVIDTVLTIPVSVSETAISLGLSSAAGALTNASLIEAVDSLADATIFVPDNEAFQAIGSALPNLTIEALTSILTYHVVNGTVGYSSMLSNTTLPTLEGNNLTITVAESGVFVNSAKVVIPDVLVANGVVHVIDNVLNPNNATATNSTSPDDGAPAFPGASSVSEPPFTSGVPTAATTVATAEATNPGGAGATSAMSDAGAQPMVTAGVGMAALFGAGAAFLAV